VDTLGCRIVHLLPVNPTPTTYARFGRFGSPYAALDLTAIDPALVEFDKRTTGVDQFRELTYAAHQHGARVFLDIVINHTGWGARLQETHPEWYLRAPDGSFVSPGAWGVTWEDLAELSHANPALWEDIADALLVWCRRGVDGFRCDAGYKIPVPAWQYITARVLDEFPETIFLLEGLGGSWEATENLLTDGGMQWAYSELFQNYSGREVAMYLDYCLRQSERVGVYVHYSETHDNERLARLSREWSLLRNQLCALTSVCGGFGFTCGVEWLAAEKLKVHESRGLAWGNPDNLVAELGELNRLLADHPCFFDGAALKRLSADDSPVLALSRTSAEGLDRVLVLVNTDVKSARSLTLEGEAWRELGQPAFDLVGREPFEGAVAENGEVTFDLAPGACHCLASSPTPRGWHGDAYRRARAQAAWAVTALSNAVPAEEIGPYDWRKLASRVDADPQRFLAALDHLNVALVRTDLLNALDQAAGAGQFQRVIPWRLLDARRITPVPSGHWLLLQDEAAFRATLSAGGMVRHVQSIAAAGGHLACFPPDLFAGDAELSLERYADAQSHVPARLRFLAPEPSLAALEIARTFETDAPTMARETGLVLLTNGRGGMARLHVDLGAVQSKYDCALGANLHPAVPVDRHIFVKRIRAWVVADGFLSPLNAQSLIRFTPGPPAEWCFVAGAGDGRAVEIHLAADMLPEKNVTVLRFSRPPRVPLFGRALPDDARVSLVVRVDILDRNFHHEAHRNPAAEHHFATHCQPLGGQVGFEFVPAAERRLRAFSDRGRYHHEAEWCMGVAHPVEAARGQEAHEDAFSPGWFELPVARGTNVTLTLSAERSDPTADEVKDFEAGRRALNEAAVARASVKADDAFGRRLALAVQAFLARRNGGKTVIAGYPWFLDWGRDSLICARGLLAAGLRDEVRQLLEVFGRFEQNGTLPNTIYGEDATNRDTSDAPLWYGVVCEELAALEGGDNSTPARLYAAAVDHQGRTIADVLASIAAGYARGTPNGVRMDAASGLIFSPTHFTWMDTNHPAGTPREGYPVEVQVLWVRLLRQLARLGLRAPGESWSALADRAEASFHKLFWLDDRGWFADVLLARPGQPAADATPDTALRSNCLFAVSLGLVTGERARRCVDAARRYLVVPGALRSLAPLPVSPPLPIYGHDGRLLNDPDEPYCGRYEGDEDTRRKPAYHNGTAWTWTFPVFCEALARAWNFAPAAVAAARAYLGSLDRLLVEGCVGQLPEIVDGDAPHTPRGCDAQAWSVTEALRVWKLLNGQ
jgi:predicted glycogen debranching enzyme